MIKRKIILHNIWIIYIIFSTIDKLKNSVTRKISGVKWNYNCILSGIFCLFLLYPLTVYSTINPAYEPLKSKILKGIELTINNQFDDAQKLYHSLIQEYPGHPLGYFYKGAALQAKMLDAEDYSEKQIFYSLMKKAIDISDSLKKLGKEDTWINFYQGSAYLYCSFMKAKEGKWFSAYSDARRGVKRLERAIAIDGNCYDAYLGIGSFKFWKSAKAGFLLWLPIISDEREEGIEMVRQAIQKGLFVYWIGRDQLSWILMNAGQKEEAFQIALENYRNFPQSRFFKWTLVEMAYRNNEFDICYPLYLDLLKAVRSLPGNNHYNELECLLKLADIELKRKDWKKANRWVTEALNLPLSPEIRKRAKKKLERLLKIKKQIDKQKN